MRPISTSGSTRTLGTAFLAAYSAKRDQSIAISNKSVRSPGDVIVRASSTHWAAKWRYASTRSTRVSPRCYCSATIVAFISRPNVVCLVALLGVDA